MKYILSTFFLLIIVFVNAQSKPEVVVTSGHTEFISTVDVSRNGQWMATGSLDKTIKIYDLNSNKEFRTFSGNSGRIEKLAIDNSSKYVTATSYDDSIRVWEIETGKVVFKDKADGGYHNFSYSKNGESIIYKKGYDFISVNYLEAKTTVISSVYMVNWVYNPIKKTILGFNNKGYLLNFDIEKGEVTDSLKFFEEDNPQYPWTDLKVSKNGKLLAFSFEDNLIQVYNTQDLSLKGKLKGHKKLIAALDFFEKSNDLVSIDDSHKMIFWNTDRLVMRDTVPKFALYAPTCLKVHPTENIVLANDGVIINFIDKQKKEVIRKIKPSAKRIMNLSYDQKGKYLASSTVSSSEVSVNALSIKLWDLELNKVKHELAGAWWPVCFNPTGDYVCSMGHIMVPKSPQMGIIKWNPKNGQKIGEIPVGNQLIQKMSFSNDGSYIAAVAYYGPIQIIDIEKNKNVGKLSGHVGMVNATSFSPDNKYLASGGHDASVRIWDLKTNKEVHKITDHFISISAVKFTSDGKYLVSASWDKTIKIWEVGTWKLVRTLEGHYDKVLSLDISHDNKYIASGGGNSVVNRQDNRVLVWEIETGEVVCEYTGHINAVNSVIFDKTSDLIYSSGDEGTIKAWDYKKCMEIATYIAVNKEGYVVVTPDNYYMASKDALDAVSFRVDNKLYPFDQFDLKLNRPEIVSARLGKTPERLINAYEYIHKKRLRKMNFTEEQLGTDFHIPEVDILQEGLSLVTDDDQTKIKILAKDDKYKLNRINVWVNDVPLYGSDGIDLKKENAKSVKYEIPVSLIDGKNKIQISVLNEKGAESLKQSVTILRDAQGAKGNLYVVTIGVSKYKDERFNLAYPTKDASDISATLERSEVIYKSVKKKELLNEAVTKENIIALKSFLNAAKPDDAVVIFVAGHGVLNENFDYYYGTYDIDFDNPNEKGLAYELLDELLISTKALKKLLIMDTCHSGEVDKEEVEENNDAEVEVEDVEFRNAGVGVRKKEGFGYENSVELMESLFTDVRKGSGATVISSAGGAEFAMESDAWKNGLFTYCLLKGLNDKSADLNGDGEIVISELRTYVYKEVSRISKGMQKPTAREENISLDYRIW